MARLQRDELGTGLVSIKVNEAALTIVPKALLAVTEYVPTLFVVTS